MSPILPCEWHYRQDPILSEQPTPWVDQVAQAACHKPTTSAVQNRHHMMQQVKVHLLQEYFLNMYDMHQSHIQMKFIQ